jgi:hypothetical protein
MKLTAASIVGAAGAAVMLVAIVLGMVAGGFSDGLRTVLGDPWGRVTMLDLGVGLAFFGAWIMAREGSVSRAAPWWIALILTGNLAAGVYLVTAARNSESTQDMLLGRLAS